MSNLHARLSQQLGNILASHVAPIFKDGTRLAIIARTPGNDEADVIVTDDDLDSLVELLKRSKKREEVKP